MKLKYNDYSNLPIGKYYEILDICDSDLSKIEKDLAIIAVLLDVTEDEVYKLKPEEVYELQQQLNFLSKPATDAKKKFKKLKQELFLLLELLKQQVKLLLPVQVLRMN